LSEFQATLRPDELFVQYALSDPVSFATAISRTRRDVVEIPSRRIIEEQAKQLIRAIQAGSSAATEARRLGMTLLGSVSCLDQYARLIVRTTGMLRLVPFELLAVSSTARALLNTHIVSSIPSAATLVAIRTRSSVVRPTRMVLAIGASPAAATHEGGHLATSRVRRGTYDPLTEPLPPLASVGDEARAVRAAFPKSQSQVLTDNDATEQAVKTAPLSQFRVLHFAAHGLGGLSADRPAIVLRPTDREDGRLQASEVLRMHLNANLVTLSTCALAADAMLDRDGTVSLVQAFLTAGARAVVANLWSADDLFSLSLMREFYARLASGDDVGESLRQAKLAMRKRFGRAAAPKFWSGFVVIGDATGELD
jgi:CHAT domain-containing protein